MWLALDTSGDTASVAVGLAGGSPRAEAELHGARQHASALLPMIDRMLAEAGIDGAAGLTGVLLADGPGSFTGLRVSASVAKAMVLTRRLQLRIAPSLLILAAGALPSPTGPVLTVIDALRGELYGAVYELRDGMVITNLAPTVAAPDALIALAAPFAPRGVTGQVAEAILARLHTALGASRLVPPAAGAPVLLSLLAVGDALEAVVDVRRWEPTYGRPAEAQRKWEETHGRPLPPASGHGS